MDKKKFLVTMLAAVATAIILVLVQRAPQQAPPPGTPPQSTPAPQVSLPDESKGALIVAGQCAPTECRFSPVITPAFEMTSGGKPLVGIWNISRSAQATIALKNVSPDPVTFSALTLSLCLNDQVVPLPQVPDECRFLKVASSDYHGGTLELKPGDTLHTTLEADTHGQVAKLQFDTTRGPVIIMVTVQ